MVGLRPGQRHRKRKRTPAQVQVLLEARRALKAKTTVPNKGRRRRTLTSSLNKLSKFNPVADSPVIVFPNVSSFRSVTNRLKGSKKKITAAMVQRGGRLVQISP